MYKCFRLNRVHDIKGVGTLSGDYGCACLEFRNGEGDYVGYIQEGGYLYMGYCYLSNIIVEEN